jgi:hypothetical protein
MFDLLYLFSLKGPRKSVPKARSSSKMPPDLFKFTRRGGKSPRFSSPHRVAFPADIMAAIREGLKNLIKTTFLL